MDKSILIQLVKDNPALWDTASELYHNRELKPQIWNEIAEKLELPLEDVKRTWQYLRDSFRREYRRCKKITTDPLSVNVKWPYYKQLFFLKDTTSNTDETVAVDEYYENIYDDQENSKPTKRKISGDGELKRIKITKLKTEQSKNLIEDDDYHFVMSILPYLRKLPEGRKLGVRMSIMGTLQQELDMCREYSKIDSRNDIGSENVAPVPESSTSLSPQDIPSVTEFLQIGLSVEDEPISENSLN